MACRWLFFSFFVASYASARRMNVVAASLDSSCCCRFLLTLFFSLKQALRAQLSGLTKELKLFFPVRRRKIQKSIIHHHCAILALNKHSERNREKIAEELFKQEPSRVPEKLYHLSFSRGPTRCHFCPLVRISSARERPICPNFF